MQPVPIVQEVGGAPEPVWTHVENLTHTKLDLRTVQLYRLRYPGP